MPIEASRGEPVPKARRRRAPSVTPRLVADQRRARRDERRLLAALRLTRCVPASTARRLVAP